VIKKIKRCKKDRAAYKDRLTNRGRKRGDNYFKQTAIDAGPDW